MLGAALMAGFAWYERTHPTSRVLALVATLAALAALGRVAFAPLPNVKPTTDIVLISGYVLGGAPGFVVGAVAALASNLFFGQGPWTPWQMVGWGGVGVAGAVLARLGGRNLGRVPLAVACGVAGLAFGALMNLQLWVTFSGDHTAAKLGATFATSLPFDIAHAAGNVVFCLAFGPALVRALARFRTRMEVTWLPAPAVANAAVALAVLAVVLAPAPARAQSAPSADAAAASRSLAYLAKAQNDDGGWGGAPGQSSSGLYTGWAALGVAAAGRNPLEAGSPSVVAYLRANASDLRDLGAVSRTILVFTAAGASPRDVGGRDLVAELVAKRKRNGAYGGRVNTTAFAILALRAAGRSTRSRPVRSAGRWLAGQANPDGGFNFAGRGGPSGIDDTGAAIQGLVAAGPQGHEDRAPRRALHGQAPEPRRRLPAGARRRLQRPVDRVGDPGPAGRGPRSGQGAPRRLARPHGVPALADGRVRRGPLLAHQPPDAGVGDRAGRDGARPQAAAARPGRPPGRSGGEPGSDLGADPGADSRGDGHAGEVTPQASGAQAAARAHSSSGVPRAGRGRGGGQRARARPPRRLRGRARRPARC